MKHSITAPFSAILLIVAGGCGAADEEQDGQPMSVETATHVAALEVNEDGSDVEHSPATRETPRLLKACGLGAVRAHLIKDFDADESGDLDREERIALSEDLEGIRPDKTQREQHRGTHRTRRLARRARALHAGYDMDESGDLNENEKARLEADLEARCDARRARLLAAFDADESGDLDDTEWETAHAALRKRFAAHRAEIVTRFDTNDDGKLDAAERLVARETRVDEQGERLRNRVAEFDADESGELDEEERTALRDAFRSRVRGERPAGEEKPVREERPVGEDAMDE